MKPNIDDYIIVISGTYHVVDINNILYVITGYNFGTTWNTFNIFERLGCNSINKHKALSVYDLPGHYYKAKEWKRDKSIESILN